MPRHKRSVGGIMSFLYSCVAYMLIRLVNGLNMVNWIINGLICNFGN